MLVIMNLTLLRNTTTAVREALERASTAQEAARAAISAATDKISKARYVARFRF